MKLTGNTVLITGGATGIGLALAAALLKLDNTVVICGRRQEKLDEVKREFPELETVACDVSKQIDRQLLFEYMSLKFGNVNILVNNAGIQKQVDLKKGADDILNNEDEIDINMKAQIYLSAMFVPLLSKQKESAIVNVSSGLGFVPLVMFPVYSATKAAMHSFTMSMRQQLKETSIKVFELIPPIVHDTHLKGKHLEKQEWSVSSSEVAEELLKAMELDQYEVPVGAAKGFVLGSKDENAEAFKRMNA